MVSGSGKIKIHQPKEIERMARSRRYQLMFKRRERAKLKREEKARLKREAALREAKKED